VVSDGAGHSGPAVFVFDTESGDVAGWNPGVPPPPPSTVAQVGTHVDDAIYKGLAMASVGGEPFLYAANFHAGTIDVFDSTFHLVHLDGPFTDPHLPKGYAPFNAALLGGQIYVTYAVQDAAAEDEVAGQGRGLLDVFDTSGHFIRRLVSHGQLDAPWGLALAPAGFGPFGGDVLFGNFGDGRINAYDGQTGEFQGKLRGEDHKPIVNDGLWALMFGNGTTADSATLLFTAGIDDEAHGLSGTIRAASCCSADSAGDEGFGIRCRAGVGGCVPAPHQPPALCRSLQPAQPRRPVPIPTRPRRRIRHRRVPQRRPHQTSLPSTTI
jgi:uncharacterized protein (TIGR03118 family)